MTTSNRDANLLIVALSPHSHLAHAGIGVSAEVIAGPSHAVATRVRLPDRLVGEKRKWSDYKTEAVDGTGDDHQLRSVFRDEQAQGGGELVRDWKGLDAFFRHLLFTLLKLPKPPLHSSMLLTVPPNISNDCRDRITQLVFQNLQIPALYLADLPLVQVFACNAVSGVTIDIGLYTTAIGVVEDSAVEVHCCSEVSLGERDCDDYLLALLLTTLPDLVALVSPDPSNPLTGAVLHTTLTQLLEHLKTEDALRFVPALASLKAAAKGNKDDGEDDDEGITDVAQALVSGKADRLLGRAGRKGATLAHTDSETVSVPNPLGEDRPSIPIGPFRHRYAEPLFEPALLRLIPDAFAKVGMEEQALRYTPERAPHKRNLLDAVVESVGKLEGAGRRASCWEAVVVTGRISRVQGLPSALVSQLISQYLPNLGYDSEGRSRSCKWAKVPDYFSDFKEHPEWAAYLGACITAKMVFADSSAGKLWMSKPGYNKEGPYISRKLEDLPA